MNEALTGLPETERNKLFTIIDFNQYFKRYNEAKLKKGELGATEWRQFCDYARRERDRLSEWAKLKSPDMVSSINAIVGIPLLVQREGQRKGYRKETQKVIEEAKAAGGNVGETIRANPKYQDFRKRILDINEQDAQWQQDMRDMIVQNSGHPELANIMEKVYNTLADTFYNRYENVPESQADFFMKLHTSGVYAPLVTSHILGEFDILVDEVTSHEDVYNGIDYVGQAGPNKVAVQIKGHVAQTPEFKVEKLGGFKPLPTTGTSYEIERAKAQNNFITGVRDVSKRVNQRFIPLWIDISGFMNSEGRPLDYSGKTLPNQDNLLAKPEVVKTLESLSKEGEK